MEAIQHFLHDFFHDVWTDRWDVFMFVGMFYYRKQLMEALKGGNGKWQIDEIGKGLILIVFYLAFRTEATRATQYNVFPESFWFAILGSVALIAGVNAFQYMHMHKADTTVTKTTHSETTTKQNKEDEIH